MEAEEMKIKLDEGAYMPERAHDTDAGLDLRQLLEIMEEQNEIQ